MLNWNQFRNLPNIKILPIYEQHRQYFIYETDMFYINKLNTGGKRPVDKYIDDEYIDNDYF